MRVFCFGGSTRELSAVVLNSESIHRRVEIRSRSADCLKAGCANLSPSRFKLCFSQGKQWQENRRSACDERSGSRPLGEIGRHARLRILCRKASGFDSPSGHLPLRCFFPSRRLFACALEGGNKRSDGILGPLNPLVEAVSLKTPRRFVRRVTHLSPRQPTALYCRPPSFREVPF